MSMEKDLERCSALLLRHLKDRGPLTRKELRGSLAHRDRHLLDEILNALVSDRVVTARTIRRAIRYQAVGYRSAPAELPEGRCACSVYPDDLSDLWDDTELPDLSDDYVQLQRRMSIAHWVADPGTGWHAALKCPHLWELYGLYRPWCRREDIAPYDFTWFVRRLVELRVTGYDGQMGSVAEDAQPCPVCNLDGES